MKNSMKKGRRKTVDVASVMRKGKNNFVVNNSDFLHKGPGVIQVVGKQEVLNLSSESSISNLVNERLKKEELGNYELYSDLGEAKRKAKRRRLYKKFKDEIMASRMSN